MFEKIKNKLNGESSSDKISRKEYESKEQEVADAKKEADETEGELKSEMVEEEEYSLRRVVQEYVPPAAEERYQKAMEKLEKMKSKQHERANKLNSTYDSLISDRNTIIEKIAEASDTNSREEFVRELGRKNKEIKTFEEKELGV